MVEQVALCIETHDLATRAESRVNTHHPLLSEWCREQKLAQILGKDEVLRRLAYALETIK